MNALLTKILRFLGQHIFSVGLAGGVAVLIVGVLVFVIPQFHQVQAVGGLDYSQKQQTLQNDRDYLKALQDLQKSLSNVSEDDVSRMNLILPHGKDIPGIFKQMQSLADQVKMEMVSVSVADGATVSGGSIAPAGSALQTLTINVVLNGTLDYQALRKFLSVVSRQAPILDLTSITHNPTSASASANYNFIFRSYYLNS